MKLKQIIIIMLMTLITTNAHATTDCRFGVKWVQLLFNVNSTIQVHLINTYSTNNLYLRKDKSILSEANLNRFYSTAMNAYVSNKQLQVRYPEDGLDCATLSGVRNDFLGVIIRD